MIFLETLLARKRTHTRSAFPDKYLNACVSAALLRRARCSGTKKPSRKPFRNHFTRSPVANFRKRNSSFASRIWSVVTKRQSRKTASFFFSSKETRNVSALATRHRQCVTSLVHSLHTSRTNNRSARKSGTRNTQLRQAFSTDEAFRFFRNAAENVFTRTRGLTKKSRQLKKAFLETAVRRVRTCLASLIASITRWRTTVSRHRVKFLRSRLTPMDFVTELTILVL